MVVDLECQLIVDDDGSNGNDRSTCSSLENLADKFLECENDRSYRAPVWKIKDENWLTWALLYPNREQITAISSSQEIVRGIASTSTRPRRHFEKHELTNVFLKL